MCASWKTWPAGWLRSIRRTRFRPVIDGELKTAASRLTSAARQPSVDECRSAKRSRPICSAISRVRRTTCRRRASTSASCKEVEIPLVLTAAMTATRGNQIKAADLLGLNRNTLRKKIRDLGVNVYKSSRPA
jgi:DNA-binding NtrC family response regulator